MMQQQQQPYCNFLKIIDGRSNSHGEKCALYFRNLSDLIHHIEEEHIPLIENAKAAEQKNLKERFGNDPEQYEKAYAAIISQPVPLSLICKLKPYPKGHKVQPIPAPKPRTLKFCHYKPKPQISQQQQSIQSDISAQLGALADKSAANGRQIILSGHSKKLARAENQARLRQISSPASEAAPSDLQSVGHEHQSSSIGPAGEEKKFRCSVDGCSRTYKNQQGLRQHLRAAHNCSIDSTSLGITTKLSASEEGILSRQLPGRQSPFVSKSQEVTSSASSTPRSIEKYQCQQCMKEFKGVKAFANLNKHLNDVHKMVLASPSAHSLLSSSYPSPSPLASVQQVYSPQQSPQRPISSGNVAILPSSKSAPLQQSLVPAQQSSFIAPVLTARHQQSTFLAHQSARPSAPLPPTSPLSSGGQVPQSVGFPQHQPSSSTIIRLHSEMGSRNLPMMDQSQQELLGQQQLHPQQQQQHFYITTQQTTAMDPQPPVLQPQQQPSQQQQQQQRYHRYTGYQQQQMVQQRQLEQQPPPHPQQIYSPASFAGASSLPAVSIAHGGTTTIYLTQNQQKGTMGLGPGPPGQHPHYGVQQVEYEKQQAQDSYGTSRQVVYRQPHYMVEPMQQQQQHPYSQSAHQNQLVHSSSRLAPAPSIRVTSGANQQPYLQQQPPPGTLPQQQQSFHTPTYVQRSGGSIYQGMGGEQVQQQPQSYLATSIRTTPVQSPQQRIYQHQQHQSPQPFYSQPRPHTQSQRQSPATVEAVLAAASPQQGANSPSVYGMH